MKRILLCLSTVTALLLINSNGLFAQSAPMGMVIDNPDDYVNIKDTVTVFDPDTYSEVTLVTQRLISKSDFEQYGYLIQDSVLVVENTQPLKGSTQSPPQWYVTKMSKQDYEADIKKKTEMAFSKSRKE